MTKNNTTNNHLNFYQIFVQKKQPVLIKNIINSTELKQLINNNESAMTPDYGRGSVPFLYLYFDNKIIRNYIFSVPLIKSLKNNGNTLFRDKMRFWQHNKGNKSHFHYDQRSTDLLNICISGSKKWLFLAPETPLKCLTFYNIALPFQKKITSQSIEIIMEAGDLLYIPRNWFHQVTTLENNTQNINVIFNDLTDGIMQSREKELAAIKNFFIPHYVYGDNIAVLNNAIKSVSFLTIMWRIIVELLPVIYILILFIIIFYFIS